MKRLMILGVLVILVCALAACGTNNPEPTNPTGGESTKPSASQPDATGATTGNTDATAYFFMAGSVKLVPCAPFDATVLPEPSSTFEVPSCAFEGTDKVYNYETKKLMSGAAYVQERLSYGKSTMLQEVVEFAVGWKKSHIYKTQYGETWE